MKISTIFFSLLISFNTLFGATDNINYDKIVFYVDTVDDDIIRILSEDKKVEKYFKSFKIADRVSEGDLVMLKNGKIKVIESNFMLKSKKLY
jgi:hypothetical protein